MDRPTALLLGSCKCNVFRPLFDEVDDGKNKSVDRKTGIRRNFMKYGRLIPQGEWVRGDLDNVECLIHAKRIDLFERFEYRERDSEGLYSRGKRDVLRRIGDFFGQEDKTQFILYYSGSGDQDGSWVFPLTTRFVKSPPPSEKCAADDPENARREGGGPASPVELSSEAEHSFIGASPTPTPRASSKPAAPREVRTDSGKKEVAVYSISRARLERPDPVREWNDLLKYEDVIRLWDEKKRGRGERYLMMILDCCHSGRWVQKVNGECEHEKSDSFHAEATKRTDVCIQASCRSAERCSVAENQLSSVFTKAFVAAQNRSCFEKFTFSLLDHLFVLNIMSMVYSSHELAFNPISSECAPFAGVKFFDSFDDMYLKTC